MKKGLLIALFVVTTVCLQGCVSIDKDMAAAPEATAVYRAAELAIQEIDSVSTLAFDTDRQKAYKRIARREGLSEAAQAYLVNGVFEHVAFESAKEDILLTLIRNPSFDSAAEDAITVRLDVLAFENSKKRILNAISDRKPEPRPELTRAAYQAPAEQFKQASRPM
jgi:hypothetical protein